MQLMRYILAGAIALPAMGQTIVQTAPGHGQGTNVVFAFPSAPAFRDTLIVACSYYPGTTCAAADTTWKEATRVTSTGTTGLVVYSHAVASGEANSYVFRNDNAATTRAYDISGAAYYAPINRVASSMVTAAVTSQATPAVTPSVASTLALAFMATGQDTDAAATTVGSGWTFQATSDGRHPIYAATRNALTTDTTTPISNTFTVTGPNTFGLGLATVLIAPFNATPIPPIASMGFDGYSTILAYPIQFDASTSSDPKLLTLTYAWNFGDGTTSTAIKPLHSYSSAGSYTVTLAVTNTDGQTSSVSQTAIVQTGCSGVSLGNYGAMNGFIPSPADSWHIDISGYPVDPLSSTVMTGAFDLNNSELHPDFGGGGTYGIPYVVVDSATTPFSAVTFNISEVPLDEFDLTQFPIPPSMPVEYNPPDCSTTGDNHAIIFDKKTCTVYEMYHTNRCSTSTPLYNIQQGTMWDLTKTSRRPYGMTSADVAGLSIFEGLIRYDEIVAGVINHSIRFTSSNSKRVDGSSFFAFPGTHGGGNFGTGVNMVMGMKIRLKASVNISGLGPQATIIATAMKKYGMTLADNGSNLFFQGTPDLRWNDTDLNTLKTLHASDFELVRPLAGGAYATDYPIGSASAYPQGPVQSTTNYPQGTAPAVTLTASPSTITLGQCTTLTPNMDASTSYLYMDDRGLVRPGVGITYCPTVTSTRTLTGRGAYSNLIDGSFATPTAMATVTVNSVPPPVVGVSVQISGSVVVSGKAQ